MPTGFEGVLQMATVSSGFPLGQVVTETGPAAEKGRLRELFASAMAAAMGAPTVDVPFRSAEPVLSGEVGHKADALPGDAPFTDLNVLVGASWEVLEAHLGSARKTESALPYPGRAPKEAQAMPQTEPGVNLPVLRFHGAAYRGKPAGETGEFSLIPKTTDPAAAPGGLAFDLTKGRGTVSGVKAPAGEPVVEFHKGPAPEPGTELGEEEPVILRLLHAPTDHVLPWERVDSALSVRARLSLQRSDTVPTEVTPVLDKTGGTDSSEAGSGSPEARPLLPDDSVVGTEPVPVRLKGESRQEEGTPEIIETSPTLVLAPAKNTGTTQDPGRAAGAGGVLTEREISLGDIRALAERLREEALRRLPRTVEVRLDPPRLGSVTAVLSARGADVSVKFVAATAEAGRALDASQGDLAKCLYEQGLTLAGFSVDHGASEDRTPRGERGRTVSSGGKTDRGVSRAKAAPLEALGLTHLARVSQSRLDYIV